MSKENDRALRFYHEVLGLEHLHYGLWLPDDELTVEKLKESQRRYEDYLIEHLPHDARHILDVGCGTSAMSQRLCRNGVDVEGLSPDVNQKTVFTETLDVPFHHCRFEHFAGPVDFDCLIMSESAQYIRLKRLFEVSARCLRPGGHLMVCDYFVLDHADEVFSRSGHNLNEFLAAAERQGFILVQDEDLTEDVIKTLELAALFADKLKLAIEIGTEKLRTRHRHLTRLTHWLLRKKIAKLNNQRMLIDAPAFAANKRYMFLLFQNAGRAAIPAVA